MCPDPSDGSQPFSDGKQCGGDTYQAKCLPLVEMVGGSDGPTHAFDLANRQVLMEGSGTLD